jgi:hypothetical protein
LTNSEFKKEDAKSFRIEAKFRKAINALLVCGVVTKHAKQQTEISQGSTSGETRFDESVNDALQAYKRKIKDLSAN